MVIKTKQSKSPNIKRNVECVVCKRNINKSKGLIPVNCLRKYGENKAHRICQPCWWSSFALENVNHKCPGCPKTIKKPLNNSVCIIIID